jgi:uroporphyrinogen-III synthase
MVKNGAKTANSSAKAIKKILITQPKPETEKSPYFELAKRHNVELDFHPL